MRRIHETLKPYMDAEWFESSTDAMLGDSLVQRVRAPFRVVHNEHIAKQLRRLQADRKFDAWEIHNIFPSLSPSVYATGIRLGVPLIQYLHNYRMSCVNGMFLNHGKPCFRCINGNFFPAIQTVCWQTAGLLVGSALWLSTGFGVSTFFGISKAGSQSAKPKKRCTYVWVSRRKESM